MDEKITTHAQSAVGEAYPSWSKLAPYVTRDFAQYNYRNGAHELVLFVGRPSEMEVEAVLRGRAEFALVRHGPVLFLLYRFGNAVPWSDAPFSIHLVPMDQRILPPVGGNPDEQALITVHLVDRSSGRIRGGRILSWSPAFTQSVHEAIREQAGMPFDSARYDRAHGEAYLRWSTTQKMLGYALARTRGSR